MKLFQTQNLPVGGAFLAAAASTFLASVGSAQKAMPLARTGLDYNEVGRFDQTADGVRTGGVDYRVEFDARGLQFTPALGRQAPRSFPLRFELTTIRRGGELVLDATATTARPSAIGYCVDYDRGAGITERYDVRSHGVKQSFVFEELPGTGDLVVSGRVVTDLEAAPATGATAFEFQAGPIGGISVGGVTIDGVLGIDATGQNAPGTLNWDGEHLDLVLPAAFVEAARFPLVLDPMVSTHRAIGTSGNDDSNADAAWLESSEVYLVAWERAFSATDIEIRGRLRDEDNLAVTGWFAITNGSNLLNLNPSIGAVRGSNLFAVCWQQGTAALGPFDLWGTVVDGQGNVVAPNRLTGVAPANTSTPDNEIRPDVAGAPNAGANGTIIVFENQGVGIEALRVAVGGGGLTVANRRVLTTGSNHQKPRVSNGDAANIALVYEARTSGFPSVKITRTDTSAVLTANIVTISASSPREQPDIDGDGTDFKVVFRTAAGSGGILHRDVTFPGGTTTLGTGQWLTTANSAAEPRIALVGSKYLGLWIEEAGFLDYEIHGQGMDNAAGLTKNGPEFVLGGTRDSETSPAIGSQLGGSTAADGDAALVVWNSANLLPPFLSDVRGQVYRSFEGATPVVVNPGCGYSVTLTPNGPVALGNADLEFSMSTTNAAPLLGLFLYGFGGTLPSCGSCSVINSVTAVAGIFPGPLTMSLPLPADSSFVGLPLEAQGLVLGAPSNACVVYPEISLSEHYRFVLDF